MEFWDSLASHGGSSALIGQNFSISYAELTAHADKFCAKISNGLGVSVPRPLIILEAVNEPEAIIAYLGALRAGFPIILVAEGAAKDASQIVQTYKPNVILRRINGFQPIFAAQDVIKMHPDLSVMLSTSGTTGAAKLVRLSRQNLATNASEIARYLDVRPHDRAMTLLPFHYSYGMSVLHIHLLCGAGLVLTEGSIIDAELRDLAQRMEVNSLALVPTQFELIDTLDWLPKLRYITQAGGRLDPVLAERFSSKAAAEGWRLFIMYGQTEAAPRMSYVPPEDARDWCHTIGRALEGGSFRLLDATGAQITADNTAGELVYEGPNVMMGYAQNRADLNAPAGSSVLHTGDVAERLNNGYFRIVGRTSRFVKLFGLRISLDEVEAQLRAEGNRVYVTGSDARLVIFVQGNADLGPLRALIAARYHLPQSVVVLAPIEVAPLLSSGKVDYRALANQAEALVPAVQQADVNTQTLLQSALRMPFLDLDRSFLELGGDSLAYLEVQLHLLSKLGEEPADWERMTLRELLAQKKPAHPPAARPTFAAQPVRADLLARVTAILCVIALHSTTWPTGGGAYLLLVLVGYSLARFQSAVLFEGNILRTWRSMLVPIIACYYFMIGFIALTGHSVDLPWLLLLANFQEVNAVKGLEPYWFVSTYTQIILLSTLPFLLPSVRRQVAGNPFVTGLGVLAGVVLIAHLSAIDDIAPQLRHRHPLTAYELLLLGWGASFATDNAKKFLMTCVTLLVWWISWKDSSATVSVIVLCGSLAVIWGLWINLPIFLARGLMQIGSLTLFLYIVHVPVISLVSRSGLRSDIAIFGGVLALSLLAAVGFRLVYNWIDSLIFRGVARRAEANKEQSALSEGEAPDTFKTDDTQTQRLLF